MGENDSSIHEFRESAFCPHCLDASRDEAVGEKEKRDDKHRRMSTRLLKYYDG